MSTRQQHNRLDAIESAVTTSGSVPWTVWRPSTASPEADRPPADLDAPVWCERLGWVEWGSLTAESVLPFVWTDPTDF